MIKLTTAKYGFMEISTSVQFCATRSVRFAYTASYHCKWTQNAQQSADWKNSISRCAKVNTHKCIHIQAQTATNNAFCTQLIVLPANAHPYLKIRLSVSWLNADSLLPSLQKSPKSCKRRTWSKKYRRIRSSLQNNTEFLLHFVELSKNKPKKIARDPVTLQK